MPGLIGTITLAICLLTTATPAMAQITSDSVREEVIAIYASLDDLNQPLEDRLAVYASDPVILVPGEAEIRGRAALEAHLASMASGMALATRHQLVELTVSDDLIVAQGRVVGRARPDGQTQEYPFETKNLILLRRDDQGVLKVWRVIYNSAPEPSLDDTPVIE